MTERPSRGVALVTGGSRGIGRAIVEALLETGWTVRFCNRQSQTAAAAEADLRPGYGDRVAGAAVDVRDAAAVERWVAAVLEEHGAIDLLVNNAGVGGFAPVDELGIEAWRRTLETNLSGPFFLTRAVAPAMKRAGRGWILNVASLAGRHAFVGGAAYNASKFGLIGFSEAAMLDLRQHGIRVAAILPGSVATDFHDGPDDWMLRPEDIARTVLDLLRYPERALPSHVEIRPTRTLAG